jgi:hypothetical protein
MKPTGTIVWDKRTLDGLELFLELLRLAASINNGNCVLERLARMIDLAEQLDKTDHTGRRPSFKAVLVRSANDAVRMAAGGPVEAKPT